MTPDKDSKKYNIFKIMLLGDGAVGKTTLISRYVNRIFKDDFKLTIGVAFEIKQLPNFEDSRGIKHNVVLQIWDLGGQERFESVRDAYYLGAKGAILVYDITRFNTYKNLENWLEDLYSHVNPSHGRTYVPVVLLGNKVDLKEKRSINSEDAQNWAKEKGLSYYETSAKTGVNVDESFTLLTNSILDNLYQKKDTEILKASF